MYGPSPDLKRSSEYPERTASKGVTNESYDPSGSDLLRSEPVDVELSSMKEDKSPDTKPQKGEKGVFDVAEGEEGVRLMGWKKASVLVAKVSYGIGVLGIPATFSTLGFVGGIICLLVLWSLSTLSAVYVARVRLRHPGIHSVADFGGVLFGPVGAEVFGGIYMILMLLIAGSSISSITIALNAVSSHALCTTAWAGIAASIVFVFGGLMPDMERVAFLSWAGLGCIFVANWVLTIAVLVKGHPPDQPAGAPLGVSVKVSVPFWQAMNAVTSQLFACIGSPMFFSISAEMQRPEQFVRASIVGNTFLIANYLIIGCCMYARAGKYLASPAFNTAGPTFRIVCYGIAMFGLFISSLLLTHLGAKYVFVRLLRKTRHVSHRTKTHRAVWATCFGCDLGIGLLLALAIPVFSQIVSLVGALAGGVLVIMLTGLLVLYSMSDDPTASTRAEEHDQIVRGSKGAQETEDLPASTLNTSRKTTWFTQACRRGMHTTWWNAMHFGLSMFLLVLGVFIAVAGLYATAESISMSYKTGSVGTAFSCADNSV